MAAALNLGPTVPTIRPPEGAPGVAPTSVRSGGGCELFGSFETFGFRHGQHITVLVVPADFDPNERLLAFEEVEHDPIIA
jgi:hypothetical protein